MSASNRDAVVRSREAMALSSAWSAASSGGAVGEVLLLIWISRLRLADVLPLNREQRPSAAAADQAAMRVILDL